MAISVTAMNDMIWSKKWSEVEAAVEAGFDASCCQFNNLDNVPLLSWCISFGCRDSTMNIIVKNGADVAAKSAGRDNVVHFAASLSFKTEEDSERLLRKLASLASHSLPPHLTLTHLIQLARTRDEFGYFPTHFACVWNNVRGLRVLTEELGASVTDVNRCGESPAHIAASHGNPECLLYLILRHRIPLDVKNNVRSSCPWVTQPPFLLLSIPLPCLLSSLSLSFNVLVSVREECH